MTCAHNIAEGAHGEGDIHKRIEVEIDGAWYRVQVLKKLANVDVAILSIPKTTAFLKLAESDAAEKSDVVVIGSCCKNPVDQRDGKIGDRYISGWSCDEVKCSFDHGLSGSPVTRKGEVVGMVVSAFSKGKDDEGNPSSEIEKDHGMFVPVSVLRWAKNSKR